MSIDGQDLVLDGLGLVSDLLLQSGVAHDLGIVLHLCGDLLLLAGGITMLPSV